MSFDLEKARASDEALPYPLDAKEIWISGKGQMHINPPNEPSIFFTLSDLCEFRNLFHGQAAEIERLRAELARVNQARETEIDRAGAAERIYLEGVRLKDAEIERLRGRCDELLEERDHLRKDLMGSPWWDLQQEKAVLDTQVREQAARIKELEEALVEDRARGDLYCENLLDWDDYDYKAYTWPKDAIPGYKHFSEADITAFRADARQQLQAEGKIGPDAAPRSWQITDERKAAILHCKRMLTFLKEDDAPCYDVEKITKDESVLVAMLEEAGQ